MASIADWLVTSFCFVDDYLKSHPSVAGWRRSAHAQPKFTDAEVITIGLIQGCVGVDTLKKAHALIAYSFRDWFPRLCSYAQWIARLHALSSIVGRLIQAAVMHLRLPGRCYLADSKPVPLCKPIRHGRVRLMREDGAWFGKNRYGWFFGYKLHMLVHATGAILTAILTPANWHDRDPAVALGASVQGGTLLGDTAYGGPDVRGALAEEVQLFVVTPNDAGEKRALISSIRERIETTFGQLWNRFVDRVFSRSWDGLWSTVKLKMLHCNMCHAGILPK